MTEPSDTNETGGAILVWIRSRGRRVVSRAEGVFSDRVILYLWREINLFELLASIFTPYSMSNTTSIANYSLHPHDICVIRRGVPRDAGR